MSKKTGKNVTRIVTIDRSCKSSSTIGLDAACVVREIKDELYRVDQSLYGMLLDYLGSEFIGDTYDW